MMETEDKIIKEMIYKAIKEREGDGLWYNIYSDKFVITNWDYSAICFEETISPISLNTLGWYLLYPFKEKDTDTIPLDEIVEEYHKIKKLN